MAVFLYSSDKQNTPIIKETNKQSSPYLDSAIVLDTISATVAITEDFSAETAAPVLYFKSHCPAPTHLIIFRWLNSLMNLKFLMFLTINDS